MGQPYSLPCAICCTGSGTDDPWAKGSDTHQHQRRALASPRASRKAGGNGTLPLSLRMPSMLCLAFLSPSSTSFLSSSASSSSPFPNLLRRMRLMELTSGGAQSCDVARLQQPPHRPGRGERALAMPLPPCIPRPLPFGALGGAAARCPALPSLPARVFTGTVPLRAPALAHRPCKILSSKPGHW